MSMAQQTSARRARIGIMGEFSAGKSTLCNLLLGSNALPEKVTATRLSPVWLTQGPGVDMRVALDGTETPLTVGDLGDIPIEDTRYIRIHHYAPILDNCDFVDFPGISDPNMDAEVWQRVLVDMDAMIWLTHATQAWRQTEAAVWETVPDEVKLKSVLLLTRFDKLVTEQDRQRVVARVQKETSGQFNRVFPVSLLEAVQAGDDYAVWQSSGAADLMDHLASLVVNLTAHEEKPLQDSPVQDSDEPHASSTKTSEKEPEQAAADQPEAPADEETQSSVQRVVPRRVKPSGASRRERPQSFVA